MGKDTEEISYTFKVTLYEVLSGNYKYFVKLFQVKTILLGVKQNAIGLSSASFDTFLSAPFTLPFPLLT